MKHTTLLPLIYLLCMAIPALLPAKAAPAASWMVEATIGFDATSTLHDFSGTVEADPFPVHIRWDGAVATLGGTAVVAVAKMDTAHIKRDRNMRKMFHADSFPLLTGVLKPVQINPDKLKPVPLELTVLGKPQTVPFTLSAWEVKEDGIRFEGSLSLSLKQLDLKPPVILGFIRVGDAVAVRIKGTITHPTK